MADATSPAVPDLLYPVASWRIQREPVRVALTLAFAGGNSDGLFHEALQRSRLGPSSWQPEFFQSDLFLSHFVSTGFRIRLGGEEPILCTRFLVRLLGQPPGERAVVDYRRAIVSELMGSAELRSELERVYSLMSRLRALLESSGAGRSWEPNRRQLDLLRVFKEIIDTLASSFGTASSGLRQLSVFAAGIRASEAYSSLADLVRFDARLATLSLKVGVGADGHIRGFEVVSLKEETDNPFVNSVWRRWLSKIELFLRGYRFSDAEVMARLIDAVFSGLEDEMLALIQLLGDLEFYLGALGLSDRAREAGLDVCLPELVSADSSRRLEGLFNPLLLLSGTQPVPCNVTTECCASTVLITGPNSGGKTRLLQSLALAQLLAQSGLFIPARAGNVALTPALVVSLIEETKADQKEGRLGTELIRIRQLFEHLPPGAMVLLDELCSGTNPSEGEEIFELVVSTLSRLKPQVFITTHFLAFAARLERERKIDNLGFLQVELGPDQRATFQFVSGVAATSLAANAAARLGVTREELLSLVERNTQAHTQPLPRVVSH